MSELGRVLDPECIRIRLEGRDKRQVIHELVAALDEAGRVSDAAVVEQAVLERERIGSTGIGEGLAIPHALCQGVLATAIAVGRSGRGVDFQSMDGRPVHLVFLIVGPEGQEQSHLVLLSRLARLLRDPEFRTALLQAPDAGSLAQALREREERG